VLICWFTVPHFDFSNIPFAGEQLFAANIFASYIKHKRKDASTLYNLFRNETTRHNSYISNCIATRVLEHHAEAIDWSFSFLLKSLPIDLLLWLIGVLLLEAKIIVIGKDRFISVGLHDNYITLSEY
jgi:hypothetical protein